MTLPSLIYSSRLPDFKYEGVKTVEEACSLLAKYKDKAKVIAGGTDLLNVMKHREVLPHCLISLKNIPGLDSVDYDELQGLRIGALATHQSVADSPVVKRKFGLLATACRQIATPQIRNIATVGGNLCNAAPSADTAPPLIALGAGVKIKGLKGERVVPLEDFFVGPGENVLQTDEILTEIQIANLPPHSAGVYLKLPARTAIDLALVGVATVLTLNATHTKIVDAKIVLGAVAPTPLRARKAEGIIKGETIKDELIEKAAQAAAEEAKPISDVRGSASYRKEMVRVLTKRAIKQAAELAR